MEVNRSDCHFHTIGEQRCCRIGGIWQSPPTPQNLSSIDFPPTFPMERLNELLLRLNELLERNFRGLKKNLPFYAPKYLAKDNK